MEKLNPSWDYGILVGVKRCSNQLIVVNEDGVEKVRSIRRLPVQKRWSEDNLNWEKWVPWRRHRGTEGADGDLPEGVPEEEKGQARETGRTIFIETKEKPPREFYITKKDAERYGYTRGCGGCSSWFRGLGR